MEFLMDTHTLLWYFKGDKLLSSTALKTIQNPSMIFYISSASIWEIAIKVSLNKLVLNRPIDKYIDAIRNEGFIILAIQEKDFITVSQLPFHHKDPFDRMIIAQAMNSKLSIISKDEIFKNYGLDVIW